MVFAWTQLSLTLLLVVQQRGSALRIMQKGRIEHESLTRTKVTVEDTWSWRGVTGNDQPINCEGHMFSVVEGIGDGAQGVTVKMLNEAGEDVVGKFSRARGEPKVWYSDLFHECAIYKHVAEHTVHYDLGEAVPPEERFVERHVPRMLKCDAMCLYSDDRRMIATSPFVKDSFTIPDKLQKRYFDDSEEAVLIAARNILRAAIDMTYVGVSNYDQASEGNTLFMKNGEVTFIDMGGARVEDDSFGCQRSLERICLTIMPRTYWRVPTGSDPENTKCQMELLLAELEIEYQNAIPTPLTHVAMLNRSINLCGGVEPLQLLRQVVEKEVSRLKDSGRFAVNEVRS